MIWSFQGTQLASSRGLFRKTSMKFEFIVAIGEHFLKAFASSHQPRCPNSQSLEGLYIFPPRHPTL